MPVTDSSIGWANNLVNDPITGEPNRREIAEEMRDSGLSSDQGLSRQIFNEVNHTLAEGILTVQEEAANNLQAAIAAEEASRVLRDNQLQDNIDAEEASRITSDNQLQDNIDAEEASRIAGDNALSDSLTSTETNLQTQLTALSNALNALQDKVIPKIGDTWITKSQEAPETRFGIGTWNLIKGRVLLGLDDEDSDFDLAGKKGGSKVHNHSANTSTTTTTSVQDHVLSEAELPPHSHNVLGSTNGSASVEALQGNSVAGDDGTAGSYTNTGRLGNQIIQNTGSGEGHNHPASSSSESITTVNNTTSLPPFEIVYIWERVA